VEIKNINSFRFVARALRYEMDRQIKILSQNGVIPSETRSWDGQKTVLLRQKESAADYRYLMEPDLPPLQLSAEDVDRAHQALPGLPLDRYLDAQDQQQQADWMQRYGLSAYDVGVLCSQSELMAFFEASVAAGGAPKAMANLLMGDVLRYWKIEGFGCLVPTMLVALQALLDTQLLNREGAKKMLEHLIRQGGEPQQLLQSLGLQQQNDTILLESQVRAVLKQYPQQVAAYQAGDQRLLGFLIGEAMKATQRQAAPAVLRSLLLSLLQNPVES
jgi:aspartyl-tRNA(Asn)/glutamyl-tRNA(Gln) amidotransferase subunit B